VCHPYDQQGHNGQTSDCEFGPGHAFSSVDHSTVSLDAVSKLLFHSLPWQASWFHMR
jgi:hypothetical protein